MKDFTVQFKIQVLAFTLRELRRGEPGTLHIAFLVEVLYDL